MHYHTCIVHICGTHAGPSTSYWDVTTGTAPAQWFDDMYIDLMQGLLQQHQQKLQQLSKGFIADVQQKHAKLLQVKLGNHKTRQGMPGAVCDMVALLLVLTGCVVIVCVLQVAAILVTVA